LLARDSEHDWATAWEEARTWLLRASLLGGRHALAQATGRESADVTLTWTSVMGVRYPGDVRCELPEPGPAEILGSSALLHARTTHREAVLAAVRHAANLAALNVVEREIATTRIRARALRRHWIPRLEDELRRVELDLEESERADGVQRRWAAAVARPGEGNPS
ncbi:V-type ATP synthase subunit D, partial [Amycolatopsis lexingtonensis]